MNSFLKAGVYCVAHCIFMVTGLKCVGPTRVCWREKTHVSRVLIVLSRYDKEQGQARPGFEFDEFSKAYTRSEWNLDLISTPPSAFSGVAPP